MGRQFPATVTYIRQRDGYHTHKQEIADEDADVPMIPPGHAVIILFADRSYASIKESPRAQHFHLPPVDE